VQADAGRLAKLASDSVAKRFAIWEREGVERLLEMAAQLLIPALPVQ
jgi:hypothetical protein